MSLAIGTGLTERTGSAMPEQTQINPYVAKIFDLANTYSVPITQAIAQQPLTQTQADKATLNERLRWAQLNGSGPNDPALANEAPQGTLDFISGFRQKVNTVAQSSGVSWLVIIGILAVGVVLWYKSK